MRAEQEAEHRRQREAEEQWQKESQAIEGYGYICGFRTTDNKEITRHVFNMSRQDGKGTHTNLGRINLQTGEVTMPPYRCRTAEQ